MRTLPALVVLILISACGTKTPLQLPANAHSAPAQSLSR